MGLHILIGGTRARPCVRASLHFLLQAAHRAAATTPCHLNKGRPIVRPYQLPQQVLPLLLDLLLEFGAGLGHGRKDV